MLQNKEQLWMSDDTWSFKTKDDLIFIENLSKAESLEITEDSKVILQVFKEDKVEQLWKKGEPNEEGYFTLESFKAKKFMTAISQSSLKIKGNHITLRLMGTVIFIDYLPCRFFITYRSFRFQENGL